MDATSEHTKDKAIHVSHRLDSASCKCQWTCQNTKLPQVGHSLVLLQQAASGFSPLVNLSEPLHHLGQLTWLQRLSGNLHHTARQQPPTPDNPTHACGVTTEKPSSPEAAVLPHPTAGDTQPHPTPSHHQRHQVISSTQQQACML